MFANLRRVATISVALIALAMPVAHAQGLTGAGSTFVNPIMTQWIPAYLKADNVSVNYQPIGSGGGISALINHTVDFAGSDVPMTSQEVTEAKAPVIHLPDVVGAVAIAYHINGIGPGIHLTGPVIADIYLGKITNWNDPRITKLSPGTKFPSEPIVVVHRSDGSGTTAIFTNYLSKISPGWKSQVGEGKSVNWPSGLGGKGSAGVAGLLSQHEGAIGYVELAYAVQNNVPYAFVQNAKGKFIYPSVASAAAAAAGVKAPANLQVMITNSPSAGAYPITGYSYLIVYQNPAKAADLRKFLIWVVTTGQGPTYTKALVYAPLPTSVVKREQQLIATIK
jgi:phosphate transport system substrate-binding protein